MAKQRIRVAAHADGRVVSRKAMVGFDHGRVPLGSGFEGAQHHRRLASFRPADTGINSLLIQAGPALRARSRYLTRNNPYMKRAKRVFVTYAIGTGIRPIPLTKDDTAKAAIIENWDDWTDEADADGTADYYGQQSIGAGCLFDAGEFFIRRRPRRASDGLTVPMQLQLLESDMCPFGLNMPSPMAPQNAIRAGIEFNPIGKRVAYWFWRQHPGEIAATVGAGGGYTRVPADDVLHVFEVLRPGQVRGLPWVTAAIVKSWLLDQYDDAELDRKKVAALIAGFIKRVAAQSDEPPPGVNAETWQKARESGSVGDLVQSWEPGSLITLEDGEDIVFADPKDVGNNYEAFEYRNLLAMCAGADVPYSNVTGDYRNNFSAERARQMDWKQTLRPIQRNVFMIQMCRPTFRWFVGDGVLSGALPIKASAFNAKPRAFTRAEWIPPAMPSLDPLKDVQADTAEVRAGFASREEKALARGKKLSELDAAIQRSNRSADEHGLVLDSDPRRVTKGASAPPAGGQSPGATPSEPDGSKNDQAVDDNDDEIAA
jgi:lambda family phage portal protein